MRTTRSHTIWIRPTVLILFGVFLLLDLAVTANADEVVSRTTLTKTERKVDGKAYTCGDMLCVPIIETTFEKEVVTYRRVIADYWDVYALVNDEEVHVWRGNTEPTGLASNERKVHVYETEEYTEEGAWVAVGSSQDEDEYPLNAETPSVGDTTVSDIKVNIEITIPEDLDEAVDRATEQERLLSNARDAADQILQDELETNLNDVTVEYTTSLSEPVGDPVRMSRGEFVHTETDASWAHGEIQVSVDRQYRSRVTTAGSFGLGWAFTYDTRIIRGRTPGIEAKVTTLAAAVEAARTARDQLDEEFRIIVGDAEDQRDRLYALETQIIADIATLDAATRAGYPDYVNAEIRRSIGESQAQLLDVRSAITTAEELVASAKASRVAEIAEMDEEITITENALEDARASEDYAHDADRLNANTVSSSDPEFMYTVGNGVFVLVTESGVPVVYQAESDIEHESTTLHRDGSTNYFPDGTALTGPDPSHDELYLRPDGTITRVDEMGTTWLYSLDGQLSSIADRNGNTVEFTYQGPHLRNIRDDYGREIAVDRDATGRIIAIHAPDDRRVEFGYDAQGMLAYREDASGDRVAYFYEENRLVGMEKPDGSSRTYHYVERNDSWVVDWTEDEEGHREYFDYYGEYREYTDPSGITERHWFDSRYRTTKIQYPDGFWIEMDYDEADNMTLRRDSLGAEWIFDHDQAGNVAYARDPNGNDEFWEYNEFSQVTKYTDQEGYDTIFDYDAAGNLREIHHPDSTRETFEYDGRGRVISWNDRRGKTTGYGYDRYGNVAEVSRPDRSTWYYTYDAYGNLTSETDGEGFTTTYRYNNDNQIVEIIHPHGGGSEYFEYDNRKDLVLYRDQRSNETHFEYDNRHLLRSVSLPEGQSRSYEYRPDAKVDLMRVRGRFGTTTIDYEYTDPRGWLTRETVLETGISTEYAYTRRGKLETLTDPRRNPTTYAYDDAGRLTSITDAHGFPTIYRYFNDGQIREIEDRRQTVRSFSYTPTNQLEFAFDEDGTPHEYRWEGPVLDLEIDRRGFLWDYEYDGMGRLTDVNLPGPHYEHYTYDGRGLLETYRDASGAVTEFSYDALGRLETRSVPGTGATWDFDYDAAGNRVGVTDPRGNRTAYRYDNLDRLTSILHPGGAEESFAYDRLGNLREYRDGEREPWRFTYDESGRLRATINPLSQATTYVPDANGNVQEIADPVGRTMYYTYDELNRLRSVSNELGETYRYDYDPEGNLTADWSPDGVAHYYTYNDRGLLSGETNRLSASASYGYDLGGNLTYKQSFSGEITTFAYDERSRLVRKNLPDGSEEYSYDGMGRLTRAENAHATLAFAYDRAGRLTRAENQTLGEAFRSTYDPAGNLTSLTRVASGRTTSYQYGTRNELTSVEDGERNVTRFTYDRNLREISRSLPNGITIERRYDAAGRLLTIAPSSFSGDGRYAARGYVYNEAGQITARVDETGAVRIYAYDEAGRLASVQYPYTDEKKRLDLLEQIRVGLIAPAIPIPDGESEAPSAGGPPPWSQGRPADAFDYDETEDLIPEELAELLEMPAEMLSGARPVSGESTPFASPIRFGGTQAALASRLRSIAGPGVGLAANQYVWTEEFGYDTRGNRDEVRNGWGRIDYEYDAGDRIRQAGVRRYEHDGDGNLVREVLGTWDLRYAYDGEDRMIEAAGSLLGWTDEGPQPERMRYTYDALGRRMSLDEVYDQGFDTGRVDIYYLYANRSVNVAAELREIKIPGGTDFLPPGLRDKGGPPGLGGELPPGLGGDHPGRGNGRGNNGNGGTPPPFAEPSAPAINEYSAREYVRVGRQIISHTDLVSRPVHKSQTSWYHTDVRGSTMMLSGEQAQVSAAYQYDAYGSVYGERPVVGVPRPVVPEVARPAVERGTEYLYTGSRLDAETGLADYGFRDYASHYARFTSVDPIRDGRNWFAYVEGDPINRVDLWGLAAADAAQASTMDLPLPMFAPSLSGAVNAIAPFAFAAGIAGGILFQDTIGDGKLPVVRDWVADLVRAVTGTEKFSTTSSEEPNRNIDDVDDPDEWPDNPDDWEPPEGVTEEGKTREATGGRNRQWKNEQGEIVRRWDQEGRAGGRDRGPHWHDSEGNHVLPGGGIDN
jgi:RHS repeat-associated protein